MNMLLSILASHLLSVIESSLVSEEPEIVATIEKEIELLIIKLQSFIKDKSPTMATVVSPILDGVNTVADASIEAAANAAIHQGE